MLVSHDRALLRDRLRRVPARRRRSVREFDGDLDDYLAWLNARREQGAAAKEQTSDKLARKQARAAAAADRQAKLAQRRPLLKEVETLESCLAAWHEEKREIDESLADPSFYESPDPDKLKAVALQRGV